MQIVCVQWTQANPDVEFPISPNQPILGKIFATNSYTIFTGTYVLLPHLLTFTTLHTERRTCLRANSDNSSSSASTQKYLKVSGSICAPTSRYLRDISIDYQRYVLRAYFLPSELRRLPVQLAYWHSREQYHTWLHSSAVQQCRERWVCWWCRNLPSYGKFYCLML